MPGLALVCAMLVAGSADAQTLQRRATAAQSPRDVTKPGTARRLLPVDAEGEYCWREPGEVIELYVEEGKLRGYLTRRSERRDPASAPIAFDFVSNLAEGTDGRLHFTTRRIHAEWYSFEGHVERGPAPTPRQEGYYLLLGTLHWHGEVAGEAREDRVDKPVSLKLSATRDASP